MFGIGLLHLAVMTTLVGNTEMDEELNRLKNLEISVQEIIEKSKSIAAHHDMILRHGVPNRGNGDCAPESAIDNLNLRDEFHPFRDTIYSTPQELRDAVVKNLKGNKAAFEFGGYSDWQIWKQELNKLRQPREWASKISDMMLPGIAFTLKKNILIIKTRPASATEKPIDLVLPETFGTVSNTEIPIILAYNGNHYEGMVPEGPVDIQQSIEVVQQIKNNEYNVRFADLPGLQNILHKRSFGVIHSPHPSPIKKKSKANRKDARTHKHETSHSTEESSKKLFVSECDQSTVSLTKFLAEKDQGTSLDPNQGKLSNREDNEKYCLFCEKHIKSYIPHLKDNINCINFYFMKYDLAQGSYEEKLEKLKKKLKLSEQSKKRLIKDSRKEENAKRKEKALLYNQDISNCIDSYWNIVANIMKTLCTTCKCFVSPNSCLKTDENHDLYEEYGQIWICKWCDKLQRSIRDTMIDLTDDATIMERKNAEWAKKNFTLGKKIFSLRKTFCFKNSPSNIGYSNFQKLNRESMVVYPILDGDNFITTANSMMEETSDKNYPTFLLAEDTLADYPMNTVEREVAELAARSCHKKFSNYISLLYIDRHSLISKLENKKLTFNSQHKYGKIIDGNLILSDMSSVKGCLSEVKGSQDFWVKNESDIQFSQLQNGTTNIKINWTVFPGFSALGSDCMLALTFLRTKGYSFASMIKRSGQKETKEYRMYCEKQCDPFNCTKQSSHPSPLEILNNGNSHGLSNLNIDPLTIARYVSEKVNAFVNKCVKPNSKEYALFLTFDRPTNGADDCSILLCGHIWTDELLKYKSANKTIPENINLIPEIFREETLKKLLGDYKGSIEIVQKLVTWPMYLYEQEKISTETLQHLQSFQFQSFRETSIMEFMFSSARRFELKWRSQAVVFVETGDQRKLKFKKSEHKLDSRNNDCEAVFFHPFTNTWWNECESIVKDYKGRPSVLDALVLLQMAIHYKELLSTNKNYMIKLKELENSDGIQVAVKSLIPLVTDQDRFPSAPSHLPEFILINRKKILQLKCKENIVKFTDPSEPLTTLMLCCPWSSSEDIDKFGNSSEVLKDAILRRDEILQCNSFEEELS